MQAAVAGLVTLAADVVQFIEAGCDDPDYGESETWPSWCDAHHYAATAADE